MAEVLFYHLERASLEDVLPGLLEKTLERRWKAFLRVGSDERAAALDAHLWTYRENSFLPHGLDRDAHAGEQPILLSAKSGNANEAHVLFFADGAEPDDWAGPQFASVNRVVVVFDGRDPKAVERARSQWSDAKAGGHEITYWQQAASGKWEKRA